MATVKFKGELEVNLSGTELNVGDSSCCNWCWSRFK